MRARAVSSCVAVPHARSSSSYDELKPSRSATCHLRKTAKSTQVKDKLSHRSGIHRGHDTASSFGGNSRRHAERACHLAPAPSLTSECPLGSLRPRRLARRPFRRLFRPHVIDDLLQPLRRIGVLFLSVDVRERWIHQERFVTERWPLLTHFVETRLESRHDVRMVGGDASTGLGALVDIERKLQRCLNASKHGKQQQQVILDRLLCYRAEQERNRAAAASLEAFYNLAEVESQKELLDRTSNATERLAAAADRVKDSGANARIDMLGIKLQELEVKRRFSELQKNESTLQFNLRRLIGESPSAPIQVVPIVDVSASIQPGDRAELFATALESRAELKALNYLFSLRGNDGLSATRQHLRGSDPLLGSTLPGASCLKLLAVLFDGSDNQVEACFRDQQLDELRSETVRLIEVEVSSAYFAVCHRLQRLALAKLEANHRAKYIEQLEAARNTENYRYQDLADARIRLLAAESAVIHELYALRIDETNLIRAQGLYCE